MALGDGGDIIQQVKDELGRFGGELKAGLGAVVAENIQKDRDTIARLDAELKDLRSKVGTDTRRDYFGRLDAGAPIPVMAQGETTEAFVDRLQKHFAGSRDKRALRATRVMRSLMAAVANGGKHAVDFDGAISVAKKSWGDDETAGILESTRDLNAKLVSGEANEKKAAARALGTTTLGSGAALIKQEQASELIDFLHPLAVVRSMGVSTLPIGNGINMPYMSAAATASYVGENTGPNATQPSDARLVLTRKILAAIVAISKELARESSYAVDAFLRMHLARVMAAREDLAFLRGDGSQDTPRGVRYWAGLSSGGGSAHVFDRSLATGAVNVDTITADALKAMRLVEDSNVPMVGCGWIFSVRDAYGLMSKRNATTQMEIWPELRAGSFYGFPFKKSSQIPKTLAGDGVGNGTVNKSEIYFAAWAHLLIAESESLEIEAYDGGAYKDASGNVVSGITNREVVLSAAAHHDFGATFRGAEACVITSVDYGA